MTVAPVVRMVSVGDGLRLYTEDFAPRGAETALLCLPGLTRNCKDFANFAARHAGRHRVICLEYRGRGRSDYDTDWRNYVGEVYVADILHVLDALGAHRVVVVGTSLGGLLAMGLAVARPSALAGVILNDVGPTVEADAIAQIIRHVENPPVLDDWEQVARALKKAFPDLPAESPDQWMRLARNTYREGDDGRLHADWDPAIVRPARNAGAMPDYWRLFRAMRSIPVLALRGALSGVLSAQTLERMRATHPDLEAVTVEGVGHPASLDEPAAVSAVEAFLRRIDSTERAAA
ncbi:MAG: alpha/beta hydrolase [Acetobacterales bacterium]